MKRITIKDIAEHLGISVSTVSRALTDDANIRQQTKDAVLAAAQSLGYRPNPVATNLKFGRTNTVGVIVPEMVTPYASQVIAGVQEVMHQSGVKVIIADSAESWERERDNLSTMENFMVDGIIVSLCDYRKNLDIYERLQASELPMVFFDRIPHAMEVSQVRVDDYLKSFFLTEHLLRSGCRKIVHIRGPHSIYNSEERLRGYRDALRKFKVELDEATYVIDGGVHYQDGARAVENLLKHCVEFDAVFAFTDTLAIGAVNGLRAAGVAIPKDVAVASFSGTILSTIVHPQLTTVEAPLAQMGRETAKLIMEKIKDPNAPTRSIVLDSELVVRASTTCTVV